MLRKVIMKIICRYTYISSIFLVSINVNGVYKRFYVTQRNLPNCKDVHFDILKLMDSAIIIYTYLILSHANSFFIGKNISCRPYTRAFSK